MPPVVIAAAVSMAAAGAAAATWIAASTALIITIGASVAGALLTKPPSFGDYTSQQERKQVLRSSTAPQAHIYGRTVTSGLLFFAEEEKGSSTKEWVHLAIALCGHPIDGVEEIWLGDEPIRNYGSNATYEIHSDRQTADPFMLAKCASWKDDMIGKGITWARISLKFDADKFPAGIPNIKFLVRGKRVLDPRNNTVAWTDNAALCIRDYYASYLKVDEVDINTQQFIQAANICDQTVTNNGVTRKRYTINGTFDASEASSAVLDDLHLACAGEPTFMAGQHGIFVGAYYGPATMNLVNSQIVSDVQIIPEASFGDKLNIVTGTFLDPNAQFAETEFPQVRVDQYITEDGAEFVDDVKYRFVANVYQAQQLAQIKINRTRIGRSLKFTMNMSGYSYRPGYYVKFTLDELGISNQEFRITDWSINATKGVDITLRQETPAVWLDIIGQPIERPDITDFPSQGIAAPLNLSFTVLNIGDAVQGRLTWKNGTVDVNYNIVIIRQAGKIVQSIQVPGETVDITGLPRGSYEMAVVSVNHFGQHSPEAMIVAEIHAPNTPTSVLIDNGYFEYTLKPQSSDLATVSVQYDFWTSGTTKLANTSDATVTGNATRKGIGKTWTEASDKNDRIYYWYIRAINAFGTSPFIEFAAHFEMEPGKAIDFIDDNIKESETYQELDKGIVDNSQAISNANQVINNVKTDVANIQADVNNIHIDVDTIQRDVLQIQIDVDTNTADIAKNVDSIAANTANITKNAQDILANTSKINKEITDRTNAVSAEATTRANQIQQTAKTAADNLLNEKLAREAAINQTNTVVQNNYNSLATQLAQVSAGTGQQFDSARIYYFDKNPEGWSLDDAGNTPMLVTEDGWLKAPTGQAKFDARSSNDLNVNGSAYKFLKLRIRKVGTPNWVGQLFWIGSTEQSWTDARKYNIPEPSYDANGVSTLDINDLPWSASNTLRRIRLNLSSNQTDTSYYLIDFVAIGRPTPGASTAALEEERTARVNADATEAAARQTLAAQVRGGYDGTDPSQLTSGLIYSERQVRISAEQAISQSVTALQTDYNNNKSSVQQSLDTLTGKTTANANAITNLTSTVDKKADATALNSLTTRVSSVEGTVTSQGNSITSLTSSLNTLKNQTSNPWLDGSFESYANGTNLSGPNCVVTTDQRYTGSKSLKVSRGANESGNSDKILAVRSNIRENSYYRFELYALMPADQQPSNGWNCNIGFNLRDAAGNNAWPTGVVITEAALAAGGGRDRWVKFSGILSAGAGKTDAAVWISTRGANGAGTPGYTLYIDQFSIVDITEARAAQQTADANAQATSALETRVTTAEGNITSQGSQITSLRNDLTSVQGQVSQKADASALATLSTKVDQQGSTITSQGQSITDLSNGLSLANNDATASHAIPTNMLANPSFERMLDAWAFSSGGPNGAESVTAQSPASGARMLRTNPVGTVVISQSVKLLAGRTYKYGCFVRAASGTNLQDAGNNKIRLGNLTTGAIIQALAINPADLPTNSTFKEYSGTYTPTADVLVTLGLCSSINAGYQYWDDAYIVDITGEVKADANAAATTALTTRVSNAEGAITSQGSSITQLRNDLTATNAEVAKKASSAALTSLESTVTQQGKDITTQGQSITQLRNDLTSTQGQVSQKADASAVTALTQRVDQNDQSISSNTTNITDMSNRLINGLRNNWSRRIYPVQLASGSAIPSFSDIRAVAPTTVDEVADATKLDFTFAGNYTVALYSCQVKVAANTTITLGPGSRVFDDAGIVVVNGVQVASGNSTTSTVIFELKAGWNTVEFLVNQWTGQAYINLGMKLSGAVSEMYSGLGVSALSNATGVLSSNVNQIGKDVVSNAQSITQLNNSLSQTNTKVDGKADQTALNSLTGRVTTTETGLTAANNSITSLNTSVSQQSKRGANLLPDGTFESYADGYNLSNNRVLVSTDDAHGGNKCIRVTRPNDYTNYTDNSDNHIFGGFQVRDNAVFYLECWVKLDAKSTTMADDVKVAVGLSLQYQDNSWQWTALIKSAKDLSSTQWTKVSGYLKSTKSGVKQAMFRISVPNVSTVKAGNSFLIDDIVLTEVTDAYNAQSTADANASAISTLNSTVTQQGDQLTSQGNSITKLTNDLATTNTEVGKKADATALTALTNRVTQTEKDISSTSTSVTTLNNKVDAISVGGTNLIKNSGAMTGWSNVVSETYRGNAVIGATVKAGSGFRDLREVILDAPVDASEYVYSFYAKGAVDGQTMSVFFYNPNTTKSAETSQGVKSGNTDGRASFTLTTSWARYWVKWKNTPGTGTKRLILCRIESSASADQSVYISSPKLEVGNVVSDWNSAPTDSASASAVDVLTTTVNQHGDTLTSIGNRTTSLENGLSTTNTNVSKKADASALQTLQNTVTQQGNDISSQGTRLTSIETNLTSGGNLIPNPRMLNNAQGWGGNATTVDGYAAVRSAAGWQPSSAPFEVTPGDTLDLSLMCLAGQAITVGWGLRFDGPSLSNATIYASNLSYQAGEKKAVSGTFVVPAGATTARLQPNIGVTTGVTIYNVVITRRDAKIIANSSAIDSLTSKVNTQGDTITSIGNRTTSLENGLTTAQNNITKKADATAVQDLRNTVTNQGDSLTAANSSITKLQSSINRRTVFTITARGNGNSVTHGIFDESGATLFTPGRSWAVVTFAKQNDGSTAIATSKTYDVFGGAANGTTMASDIAALASGTYVCVMTFDEPSGNRGTITSALESLGGTSQVVNSLPYRGAYILLGRKGMKPGDGLELRAPTGGDSTAYISTSVEFVNGIMMGLGAAGGVMMKADANASAITTLQNTVTQQGNSITSSSNAITSLQNDLKTANDNIAKKADASALSVLQNTVTQQGNSIDSQSKSITNLTNSLVAGSLIVNGDLSVNADKWIDSGTGSSFSYNATDKAIQSGGNSIRVANVTAIPVEPGMTLTVSFELKASVAGTVPSADIIGFCETANFNGTWIMSQANWLKSMATTYNTSTYTFTVPANFTGKFLYLRFASGGGTPSNFTIFLRNVVVTSSTGVAGKADASALNALTSRVTTAEGKITANANSITSLTSRVGTAESGINGLNETVASLGLAQTTTFQQLRSMIGDNSASITTTNQAFTDLENSTANSVSTLTTQFNGLSASITNTNQAITDLQSSTAKSISTLTTQFNGLSASVQQTSNAIADVNGKLSAQWGVKVETNNGVPSVAGIQLGINANGSSAFLVKADTFGVYNPNASGGMNLAFVVKGSQTYIRESFIENGSINNAKIGNFIQSNNYVENQSGWAINKDGGAQFNNAIFRGTIYANDGVFKGTVQADRFIGDIATSASFNGFTVKGGEGSGTMNAWYQNSGYPMTITLNCTVRCNSYAGGVGDQSRDFYVILTFNINGVQSTRRVVVDMRDKAHGLVDVPQSFTVNIPASNSRIGISLTGASYGPQQSEVSVSNIVVTAFRSNNGSFGQ